MSKLTIHFIHIATINTTQLQKFETQVITRRSRRLPHAHRSIIFLYWQSDRLIRTSITPASAVFVSSKRLSPNSQKHIQFQNTQVHIHTYAFTLTVAYSESFILTKLRTNSMLFLANEHPKKHLKARI